MLLSPSSVRLLAYVTAGLALTGVLIILTISTVTSIEEVPERSDFEAGNNGTAPYNDAYESFEDRGRWWGNTEDFGRGAIDAAVPLAILTFALARWPSFGASTPAIKPTEANPGPHAPPPVPTTKKLKLP